MTNIKHEVVDDITNGKICSWCGIHFEKEHWYPVACKSCWREQRKNYTDDDDLKMDTGVQRATFKEL